MATSAGPRRATATELFYPRNDPPRASWVDSAAHRCFQRSACDGVGLSKAGKGVRLMNLFHDREKTGGQTVPHAFPG